MLQVKVKQDKVIESDGQQRSRRAVRQGLSKEQDWSGAGGGGGTAQVAQKSPCLRPSSLLGVRGGGEVPASSAPQGFCSPNISSLASSVFSPLYPINIQK